MDLGLKGKSVLVMASSGGLGKAAALEFAREGANVMLFSRNEGELRAAQAEIREATGLEPAYTVGDITRAEDIAAAVRNAAEKFGPIFALVNNSGGPPAGEFDALGDESWQRAFELNLLSYVRTIREVLPHMRRLGKGRIVSYTSSSVRQAIDGLILSNTFRTGVVGMSKSLARELGKDNILVNVMGAGRIGTSRIASLDRGRAEKAGITEQEVREASIRQIPLGRYGTPDEYARLTVFLCSEANTYITGQTVLVDGGNTTAY